MSAPAPPETPLPRSLRLAAWAGGGFLSGLILAVPVYFLSPPVYRSGAKFNFMRQGAAAAAFTDREWNRAQAATLRSPEILAAAAEKSGMTAGRGLSGAECARILGECVAVEHRILLYPPWSSDPGWKGEVSVEEFNGPGQGWDAIILTMTGPSPEECAGVVNSIVEIKSGQLSAATGPLPEGKEVRPIELMELARPVYTPVRRDWRPLAWKGPAIGMAAGLTIGFLLPRRPRRGAD